MKYFGSIEQEQYKKLSEQEQGEYLFSKGLFVRIDSFTLPMDGTPVPILRSETTKQIVPNKIVQQEFYSFILQQYEPLISKQFYNFSITFNEEKYGLKKSKQKQIALKYFKFYFDQIATKGLRVISEQKLENGEIVLENMNKLPFLETKRNALKSDLSKTIALQQFLFGNKGYFVAELIEEIDILKEVIKLEGAYKILSSLNGKYNFEQNETYPMVEKNNQQKVTTSNNNKTIVEKPDPDFEERILKKSPIVSDEEAIEYLLQSVFGKVKS
ncbi:hypothetical protein FEE95_21025 [Maribacter algarum]|uniref:Uncharacterized protein n=1 Tax=Maribacter algarum (ex Zhang et al. 2020) TaxID=2578118 RepID=A0A5S3PJ95_9FLAO|nr:hypothetical protein [Maribacter algarum]TMM52174.1 hypothetical protein FEE95_21025 [Maribacter algarum]